MRARPVCALLVVTAGCSFIAVRPSPTINEQTGMGLCANSTPPALDLIGTAGFTIFGVFGNAFGRALAECSKYPNDPGCHTQWGLYIPAAITAASAIYGFWAVPHCNRQLGEMHDAYLKLHPTEAAAPQ